MLTRTAYKALSAVHAPALFRRAAPPLGVILMCHSVGDAGTRAFDPNGRWRISVRQLEAALTCAMDMGLAPATMDTARERLSGNGEPFFVLTFDDGYADNLHDALPACRRLRVPMTVYVTSGFVRREHVAWWHVIEHLIAERERLDISLDGRVQHIVCDSLRNKRKAFARIANALTLADAPTRSVTLDELGARYTDAANSAAQSLFLTAAQLRTLAAEPDVHLGVHGVSHSALRVLDQADAERELDDSAGYLADITGARPRHLAYPFGSPEAVSAREHRMAVQLGFATAVTTRHGCLGKDDTDPWQLPRIPLFPEDSDGALRCKLSGLTTALARWRRRSA